MTKAITNFLLTVIFIVLMALVMIKFNGQQDKVLSPEQMNFLPRFVATLIKGAEDLLVSSPVLGLGESVIEYSVSEETNQSLLGNQPFLSFSNFAHFLENAWQEIRLEMDNSSWSQFENNV